MEEIITVAPHSEESIEKPLKPSRYFQIDVLKTFMMALVIMDHSFTHGFLRQFGSSFWERISIPVLMVIMGFNLVISYKHKESRQGSLKLRDLYTRSYFKKKMERFLFPYLTLYIIHFILEKILYQIRPPIINNFPYESTIYEFYGYTPLWGPGMWFIPVMLGSILVLPFLYWSFKRAPIITFIGTFLIEIGMQLTQHSIYQNQWWFTSFFWTTSILYMLSGIGLGMWIAKDQKLMSTHNLIVWMLFILSLIYLIYYSFVPNYDSILHIEWISGDYHFLAFPYSALLVLVALNVIPRSLNTTTSKIQKKIQAFFQLISNSTFHILLAQILWFSIWYHYQMSIFTGFDAHPINYLWFYPLNLICCFTVGVLWNRGERWFLSKVGEIPLCAFIYYILTLLSILFYNRWFFGQFWPFFKYPVPSTFYII